MFKSSQFESDEAFWQSSDASAKRVNAFDDSVASTLILRTLCLVVVGYKILAVQ